MLKRKLATSTILTCLVLFCVVVNAAETWRDTFVTRIMKAMAIDPSYTDLVITDIDQNNVPEVFLIKPGALGDISSGLTMSNDVVTSIDVPVNITGECLKDITIYNTGDTQVYVGKEIGRYTDTINYYKLTFSGNVLTADRVDKKDFCKYPSIAYTDYTSSDFFVDGFPSRTKIFDFISNYTSPSPLDVSKSTAKISVDGNTLEVSGYNVNGSNYYKIRDIAMILRSSNKKFDVIWDANINSIKLISNEKYTIVGGELSDVADKIIPKIEPNSSPIVLDGTSITLDAYNIEGSTYFKIRDIGDIIHFNIDWDNNTQTIVIITD